MGRRKKGTLLVSEMYDEPDPAEPPVSRTQDKAVGKRYEQAAVRLAGLPPGVRRKLSLPDEVLAELEVLATSTNGPARKRSRKRLKGMMRAHEVELDDLFDDTAVDRSRHLERWRTRLIDGSDADLQVFVDTYPLADRSHLRSLVRNCREDVAGTSRARKRLFQALKASLGQDVEASDKE